MTGAGLTTNERKKTSNNADIEYTLKEEIFPVGTRLSDQNLSEKLAKDECSKVPGSTRRVSGLNLSRRSITIRSQKDRESRSRSQRNLNQVLNGTKNNSSASGTGHDINAMQE